MRKLFRPFRFRVSRRLIQVRNVHTNISNITSSYVFRSSSSADGVIIEIWKFLLKFSPLLDMEPGKITPIKGPARYLTRVGMVCSKALVTLSLCVAAFPDMANPAGDSPRPELLHINRDLGLYRMLARWQLFQRFPWHADCTTSSCRHWASVAAQLEGGRCPVVDCGDDRQSTCSRSSGKKQLSQLGQLAGFSTTRSSFHEALRSEITAHSIQTASSVLRYQPDGSMACGRVRDVIL